MSAASKRFIVLPPRNRDPRFRVCRHTHIRAHGDQVYAERSGSKFSGCCPTCANEKQLHLQAPTPCQRSGGGNWVLKSKAAAVGPRRAMRSSLALPSLKEGIAP